MESSRRGLTTPEQLAAMKKELAEASKTENITKGKRKHALKIFLDLYLFLFWLQPLFNCKCIPIRENNFF